IFRGGHYNSRKRVSLWVRAIRVGHPWAGSKKNPAISVLPPINAEASAVSPLVFDLYRKAMFSGRFLNFNSHHPLYHKRGVIYSLVDKIIRLCHPRFQQNNLIKAINIFLNNSYPLDLIFSSIQKRIKFHTNKSGTVEKKIREKFFTIPYVSSKKFAPIANRCHYKLAFSIPNSLNNFIKKGKDQLDPLCNQNVVYKISCDDCSEASYVGQTKRKLNRLTFLTKKFMIE
ncbi:hypothetical protein ALC60_09555, partial [Trachymyrmex zeteki]